MKKGLDQNIFESVEKVRRSGLLSFRSGALPTWCPGCGYYGVIHALTKALRTLGLKSEHLVCVSGIGCSSRFPFFLNAYGFHTLHGRPLPIACGVKMANPKLSVLALGGDGDGLAIGGGHLAHAIRRNVDLVYLLMDNGIYGLTRGQASPTTPQWQITETTPYGNPDKPVNPTLLGLTFGASFVARGFAGAAENLTEIFERALRHRGFSFIHILSPCVAFDEENITYERFSHHWHPIPKRHKTSDLSAATRLAKKEKIFVGVFYESKQPTWEEIQSQIRSRAKAKGVNT